jgi:hypothetical protein
MVPHSFLWHYLWAAPHLIQIAVALIIIRRKLHREFPFFLAYTIYQVLVNVVLFALDHLPAVSADVFHLAINIDEAISILLRFAVIYEVFVVLLRPYETLKRLANLVAQFSLVALLVTALLAAAYGPIAGYASRLISFYIEMDRATSIVQCGLLLLLFVFSLYFGISWRSFGFGAASGLAFYITVQLVLAAVESHVHVALTNTIDMAAYHVSVVVWLFYAWVPQSSRVAVKSIPVHQLQSWNVELERLLQR